MVETPPEHEPVTFRPAPEVLAATRAAERAYWRKLTGEPTEAGLAWARRVLGVPEGDGQASA